MHHPSREPIPRPPLSEIVQGWNITGDPSWLLDFAIAGFPKTGTSTLMHHLRNHPEISMFPDERCEVSANQHAKLMADLYQKLPPSNATNTYRRILKCPSQFENTLLAMPNYKKFFPHTHFIAGIRHPVTWFESFYNFRVHNYLDMPPPETLVGPQGCASPKAKNVCTFRASFHIFLANLGKTPLQTRDELDLLIPPNLKRKKSGKLNVVPTDRHIFLYETRQLADDHSPSAAHRAETMRRDLQQFLGLSQPIAPFIWFKPGKNRTQAELTHIRQKQIDICDPHHALVRESLMEIAVNASRWIRQYFIQSPDVMVSSRPYFEELLQQWKIDPCIERLATKHHPETTEKTD
jgi:hypothetical protein